MIDISCQNNAIWWLSYLLMRWVISLIFYQYLISCLHCQRNMNEKQNLNTYRSRKKMKIVHKIAELRASYFLSFFFFFFFFFFFPEARPHPVHYEGCSKWIAYFYLETSKFKLAQKYSFHALEVLPVARNAKFQPMYPLLEGVTVRWFGHSNKVLMNGRSKCMERHSFLTL